MKYLKLVKPDVVEVPDFSRGWMAFFSAGCFLAGTAIFYFLFTGTLATNGFWWGLAAVVLLLMGVVGVCCVSQVLIDRKGACMLKRTGWFKATQEEKRPIAPQAIRLTMKRTQGSAEDTVTSRNALWLVQEGADDIQLGLYAGALNKLRALSEELATFLNVEYYEDKLYRPIGAFGPATGPGCGPTRTYPARNETIPLDIDESKEFATCDDALWTLTDRVNAQPKTPIPPGDEHS